MDEPARIGSLHGAAAREFQPLPSKVRGGRPLLDEGAVPVRTL